jgi:hypothetical protein
MTFVPEFTVEPLCINFIWHNIVKYKYIWSSHFSCFALNKSDIIQDLNCRITTLKQAKSSSYSRVGPKGKERKQADGRRVVGKCEKDGGNNSRRRSHNWGTIRKKKEGKKERREEALFAEKERVDT